MSDQPVFSRRKFLGGSAIVATGLVIGINLTGGKKSTNESTSALNPNAWLLINKENQIIFRLDKVEMGQGSYTSLSTLLAEELEVDPRLIIVEQAPIHPDFQAPFQVTGGSNSTSSRWDVLRETGARARSVLIRAAAEMWEVDITQCYAENGSVYHRENGQSLSYGELAVAASKFELPSEVRLKAPQDFKLIGKPLRRTDGLIKSTGSAEFGIDVSVPDMRIAVVLRNPYISGERIPDYKPSKALASPGVIDVLTINSGIAVVADTYWHARRAAALIKPDWDKGPLADLSSESIQKNRMAKLATEEGRVLRKEGSGREALKSASKIVEAIYEVPYQAHATMEPQNATVQVSAAGTATVWCPSQSPDVVQALVADTLKLPRENVTVHTTFLGGGFGRRAVPDYAMEAAEIAAAMPGVAVKLIWSREDDIQHDLYRPATCNLMRAGLDQSGKVTSWDQTMISPSVIRHSMSLLPKLAPTWLPNWLLSSISGVAAPLLDTRDPSSHEGVVDHDYDFANIQANQIYDDPGVPLGIWRSVGNSQNAFVKEGFIDELAHLEGVDPLAYRKLKLGEKKRQLEVLDLVAEKSNWGKAPEGVFQGVAVHESFGSVVAEVAEVRLDSAGKLKLERVVCAVNCGLAVNPDLVKAQIQSSVIYGLTAAIKSAVTIKDGKVVQSNFHDFQMIRMNDAPKIEVHILPSVEKPTGVGEPGLPPIAPAVANAVFAATGVRQRKLPFKLS